MTWKTSKGERVLSQPEATLFTAAIGTLCDMARDNGEGLNFGIPLVVGPFERLSNAQKYAVLEQVAVALTRPTEVLPLSALNESAVYYVYRYLQEQFDDVPAGEEVWGRQVLDAYREVGGEEGGDEGDVESEDDDSGSGPYIGCLDAQKWEDALECIADAILWDRDWEMEAQFAQMPSPLRQVRMRMMRVDEDYWRPFRPEDYRVRGAEDRLYDVISRVCG